MKTVWSKYLWVKETKHCTLSDAGFTVSNTVLILQWSKFPWKKKVLWGS